MGCGCNGMGFSGNGMGAYFKDRAIRASHGGRSVTVGRAGGVVGMDRLGRAIATDGFGAYYLAVPGQMFSGFGAAQAFTFDANQVWADWVVGRACSGTAPMPCVAAKRAVDSLRAALGQLGYGPLSLSVMWGKDDQAAYKAWAQAAGLTVTNFGLPEQAHLPVMQTQVSQNMVTGPNAPVSYSKIGDTIIETGSVVLAKAKGLGWKVWALIGAAAIVGVVIYKKRKAGKQYTSYKKTTAIEPYRGGQMQPAYSANRRRHRKTRRNGRKY
jgi:hypothetical protein